MATRVQINQEPAGIEIYFDGKPSAEIRAQLKAEPIKAGFNRNPDKMCWYIHYSPEKYEALKKLPCLKKVAWPSDELIAKLAKAKSEQDAQRIAEGKAPAGERKPKKPDTNQLMELIAKQTELISQQAQQMAAMQEQLNSLAAGKRSKATAK